MCHTFGTKPFGREFLDKFFRKRAYLPPPPRTEYSMFAQTSTLELYLFGVLSGSVVL